ncbi:uncharacterized protein LOC106154417 [Lingula anatina]|uniref:Uncharacterized protein LOC106154417 n=1 Tax=Lingula anatina TaxID=7574 RepID=A0A1S3HFH0_LINAN|nr:uncharacterized protein LOC106154417 [Lingula anatina]|eukprot:XP_013384216.1 uncharacterized protein LOC106154417 [Lingula anatina]
MEEDWDSELSEAYTCTTSSENDIKEREMSLVGEMGSDTPTNSNRTPCCDERRDSIQSNEFSLGSSATYSSYDMEDDDGIVVHQSKGIVAVIGGMLVHLVVGAVFLFGNVTTYMTSYMRSLNKICLESGEDFDDFDCFTYEKASWIYGLQWVSMGVAMFIGAKLEYRFGPRITTFLGGFLLCLGVSMSYFTIQDVDHGYLYTLLSFGLVYGFGIGICYLPPIVCAMKVSMIYVYGFGHGICYLPPIVCAMKWFPGRKSTVIVFIIVATGLGKSVFQSLLTVYANPNNIAPVAIRDSDDPVGYPDKYFVDDKVLERVPSIFQCLGITYAILLTFGTFLLFSREDNAIQEYLDVAAVVILSGNSNYKKRSPSCMEDSLMPGHRTGRILADGSRIPLEEPNTKPLEVLRKKEFYVLWLMFMCNTQALFFITSIFKIYGQSPDFDMSDHFLAAVGSVSHVCFAAGKVVLGCIASKVGIRLTLISQSACMVFLLSTFELSRYFNSGILFAVWDCLLHAVYSGNYVLYPVVIANMYGLKYAACNYGMLFTSQAITGATAALLSAQLYKWSGYAFASDIVAGFSCIGMMLAFVFNGKTWDGKTV